MAQQSKNPIQTDKSLVKLMNEVDNLETESEFVFWRRSFFENYKRFVDPDGTANAEDADKRLFLKLKDLTKEAMKVKMLSKDGNISDDQVTAEGRRALANMCAQMKTVGSAIDNFMPKTWAHEEKVGYDKWELGGVLVKDGFRLNEIMMKTRALVLSLRDGPLENILDRNSLSIIKKYDNSVQIFVDVMADLGLTNLVNKCIELYKETPRKPRKIKVSKQDKLLSPKADTPSTVVSKPDTAMRKKSTPVSSESEEDGPVVGVKRSSQKPAAKAKAKQDDSSSEEEEEEEDEDDDEDEDDGEGGEEIIFFDPIAGVMGKINRDILGEKELIITMDEEGKDANLGVIEDEGEKVDLVWMLKKLERKLPQEEEETWVDKIKREKAEKAAQEAREAAEKETQEKRAPVRVSKVDDPSSVFQGRKSSTKSRSLSNDARMKKKAARAAKGDTASASDHDANSMKTGKVKDYGAEYKKKAKKPSSSGWSMVAPQHIETKARKSLM